MENIRKSLRQVICLAVGGFLVLGAVVFMMGMPSRAAEKVTIRVAHAWDAKFLLRQKEFDKEFMKKYPDIKVKIENTPWGEYKEKYQIQAAAGTLPDVFYIHCSWAKQWIRQRCLINLQPYIDKQEGFDIDDFFKVALEGYKFRGDLYVIPYDAGPIVLYYNRDMFDAAGVGYPQKNWILEGAFLDAAKKLTRDTDGDGKVDQWGFHRLPAPHETLDSFLMDFGGRYVNDDETECLLTLPESIEGLKWWMNLLLIHRVHPTPAQVAAIIDPFAFGKIGMTNGGSWMIIPWTRYGKFKVDVQHIPSGPKGRFTSVAGSGYGISTTCKRIEEAWVYLNEYISTEGQIFMWGSTGRGSPSRWSAWPSFESVWREQGLNAKVFREAMDYGVYLKPLSPPAAQVNSIAKREIELIALGKKSVEEACKTIKKEVDPLLEINKRYAER